MGGLQPGAHYRAEVDGLRAVAVAAVMLFHAQLNILPGGYTGVDVFFVISGYLITGIILRGLAGGNFSFRQFYARRVRRIVPALTVVLVASSLLALAVVDLAAVAWFGENLAASVLFLANVYSWHSPGGYFGSTIYEKPLLHLWSLAVEEQFYLLFPVALFIVYKFARRWLFVGLIAATLASLALSELTLNRYATANFFLLPTRAWELLAGALLAYVEISLGRGFGVRPQIANALSLTGLLAILIPFFIYTETTRFPGLAALPTVAGTVLLIAFTREDRALGRVLGSAPFVGLGLISYSAYLWHQPLLAFWRLLLPNAITHAQSISLLALCLVLAGLTWRFVERPFRDRQRYTMRQVLVLLLPIQAALLVAGVVLWRMDGLPQRLPPPVRELVEIKPEYVARQEACLLALDKPLGKLCAQGSGPVRAAMFGDSHALALAKGLPSGEGTVFITSPGCPPMLGQVDAIGDYSASCLSFNLHAVSYLENERSIDTVFIAARWVTAFNRTYFNNGVGGIELHEPVTTPTRANRQAMAKGIDAMVTRLLRAGKRVVLIYPVPEVGWDVPHLMAKRRLYGLETEADAGTDYRLFRVRQAGAYAALDAIGERPNLRRVYPEQALCPDRTRCLMSIDGRPQYFDDDHVTAEAATLIMGPTRETALAPNG